MVHADSRGTLERDLLVHRQSQAEGTADSAADLDFERAAQLRDRVRELQGG